MSDWQEAEQRVERAQHLCETQRWDEALTELEAAIAINPDNAAWHAQRGCLLEELGRTADAVEAFERSLELESDDPDVIMALSTALLSLDQTARALALLENLSEEHPTFEPAYCQRIRIYAELERHEQAEQVFYLAQQINENCPDCFFHMGDSLFAREQYDRAMYCWNRVIELEPHYFGAHRRIAELHRSATRYPEAKDHYLHELRLDPGNTELLCELGDLALDTGEVDAAIAKFKYVLELDPTVAVAKLALGRIERAAERFTEALSLYQEALQADEALASDPAVAVEYAELLFLSDRTVDARNELDRVLANHPNFPAALKLQGRCLLSLEKLEEAADCFRRRLAREGSDIEARFLLAVCQLRMGKAELSLEHLLAVLEQQPTSIPTLYHLCLAYLELGKFPAARTALERALEINPNHPELASLIRRCRRRDKSLRSRISRMLSGL